MVHRDHTQHFGFTLPDERRDEANTRHVEAILALLGGWESRPPADRFAGTCRDFAVLLCAMLRHAGTPARARAGFAGYFVDGFFDDHWVVEVWDDARGWYLVDAQVGSAPPGTYARGIDAFDVPRDAFLVGGEAWRQWRSGRRSPETVGVLAAGLTGLWEVQGNVIRDLASLDRVETLPWDGWGLIPIRYDALKPADLELLDEAAGVSAEGGPVERVREMYRRDSRLAAPAELAGGPGGRRQADQPTTA
ncbi:hypothetical protein Acy02nite_83790 [Actinoplanes cyaneus]|uniref:Transglutaminase-like domain-containing protein n=2 Tax=Actinoplanes cyaneus TaxID=52696 RepID=A0A919IVI5_9ACTN|nr:hypothetical protein Acy02nite_83790 [Actinoplanes cyaneus]